MSPPPLLLSAVAEQLAGVTMHSEQTASSTAVSRQFLSQYLVSALSKCALAVHGPVERSAIVLDGLLPNVEDEDPRIDEDYPFHDDFLHPTNEQEDNLSQRKFDSHSQVKYFMDVS